jgi:SAM-dependent methyltransferase
MHFQRFAATEYVRIAEAPSIVLQYCPACRRGTRHITPFSVNGCDIRRCQGCGLGRAQTSGFDPEHYYTSDYFSGGEADGYADYLSAETVLRNEFARTAAFIRKWHEGGRLLEIGCAYGFFLHEAKPHYDVAGIELSADATSHCRKFGLDVIHGVANEETLSKIGAVDVIVMLDVIEHLPAAHETLRLLTQRLNPGGIIVITTGDFSSPFARLLGKRWRLMTPPQHLWFFSRESVCKIAASLQLSVEQIDHPWKIVPASLIHFQLRRMLGLRPLTRSGSHTTPGASELGLPLNLFDAMRVVLRKPAS